MNYFSFFTRYLQTNLAYVSGTKSDDIENTYIKVTYNRSAYVKTFFVKGRNLIF